MIILDVEERWRRDEPGGMRTMDKTKLVLFGLGRVLDGCRATGIGVSGMEVTGKLSASDEW